MSTFPISTRTALARAAVVATVTGFAALAFAGQASARPIVTDKYIEVPNCNPPGGEICPQIPSVTVNNTLFPMKVEFTANRNHCSDIIAHIIVDGVEWGSNRVGPGQSDGGYEIPASAGPHTIGVQAEGIPGGCNTTGQLAAWGGNLHIEVQGTLN
jgi:hypothetical protein